jgi:hypothetical protein
MSQKVRQIAEKDCINLGNIAPFWLIQRAKEVLYKNENIKYILDNSDSDELYLADAIQPNFSFMIDEIKDYPKAFKKAFKKALILLGGSMKLGEKDFEIIFNEISVGNLVNRDEILCRLTIALIQQKTNSVNTVNWFYWLLIKSKFEIGEHNWGRLNTFELCVLFLNKYPLTQNSRFCKEIENIAMDYQSYKKLINYMSQIYFESGQTGKAKEIILQSGSPKGEILSESTWIRQWIIHDFDKRKSKIDLLNTLDKIELYFENTTKSQNFNYADFIQSNIYVNLNKIDIVSRMEYMAEFAVRVSNNNPLSEQLILDAWDMSNEMKDWAVFFAKISVFAAALDVMSDSWINEQFKVLKRWFSKYDEDFYSLHLAENIFKTTKYRFSNSGSYQILKSKHFKIYNYLINKFPDLKDSAELEMDFNKFLLTKINNYKSIKEMWVDGRKYFNSSGPGENFILFWEKIEDTSSIFSRITKEDIRIINRISKISGARFPIERFVNNLNIKKYEYLLNLPDNYNLGYTEGLEAIAKYEKKLDFDNNFRTVFFAAMNPTSNRFKQADWTMQSISAPAFTSKKILRFEDDLVKLKSYLDIRKELLKS